MAHTTIPIVSVSRVACIILSNDRVLVGAGSVQEQENLLRWRHAGYFFERFAVMLLPLDRMQHSHRLHA